MFSNDFNGTGTRFWRQCHIKRTVQIVPTAPPFVLLALLNLMPFDALLILSKNLLCNKKITAYIAEFEKAIEDTDESKKLLKDSLQNWLEIVKFPSVEQTSYDRLEGTARCQIYPLLGDKVVGITDGFEI